MADSVTVSIGEEMRGVFNVIFLVRADVRSWGRRETIINNFIYIYGREYKLRVHGFGATPVSRPLGGGLGYSEMTPTSLRGTFNDPPKKGSHIGRRK